ncbi:receptor-like protein kinase FERONIA [Cornus florida]|uniref:receptor-like protein kinase FERONIA n=1 Tax=Cornus florida TaxID=4283 RepID=UPI0028A1BF52|nr:receptor-like protein kinase FERONIA [Cornus florida]
MNTTNKPPSLFTILASFLFLIITSTSSYTPPDDIALNCGEDHGDIAASDGRKWTRDNPSKFIFSPQQLDTSSASTASTQDYAPQVPYMTARIFHSQLTYTFPMATAGPKFLRLHFHLASYSGLNPSDSFFTVTANNHHTLLHNFSASLTSHYLNSTYFSKEYCINLVSERSLNITFNPNTGSFGFINGIEVVSMPTNLYIQGLDINIIGQNQPLNIDNNTALENIYRLNVAGLAISPVDDTGMFRSWSSDVDFIDGGAGADPYHFTLNIKYTKVQPYTAPEILYRTARSMGTNRFINENYNLTWRFPVDSGFYYLVRLHFCEIAPEITEINQRVFEIFMNNQTADDQMDIIVYAGGNGVPIYKEFVVVVPQGGGGKVDLWLALHPNTRAHSTYSDALLNGLEIFKLNKSDGSLAGPNPDPVYDPISNDSEPTVQRMDHPDKPRIEVIIVVSVCGGAVVLSILILFVLLRGKRGYSFGSSCGPSLRSPYSQPGSYSSKTGSLPSDVCHKFSLAEIKSATNNFSDALLIGLGGFGNVYKGQIDNEDGYNYVAIKRLNPMSHQGAHEFCTEIKMLTQLRHLNLVSLVGYCDDDEEMILVYDYMSRGSLRDHLYNTDNAPLSWKQRLEICIGAARGLHYLHSGAKHMIIHRDVKTSNILLDEKWVAKVSDFGLSRVGPTSMSRAHVSTVVKGSFGYLDPEYYMRQQLTEKSDVYSFGVVLFEVLCARPPVNKNGDMDEVCLSHWARSHQRSGTLDQIVDPNLDGQIAPECLRNIGEIASSCLLDQGIQRPGMADVLWSLEFALKLQESAEKGRNYNELENKWISLYSNDSVSVNMPGDVFSDIKSPRGR